MHMPSGAFSNLPLNRIQRASERSEALPFVLDGEALSTIRSADLIVMLEGRSIVERGTHEALIARDSLYRSLNEAQLHDEARLRELIAARRSLTAAD